MCHGRNTNFWMYIIPSGIFVGVSSAWIGVMNFSLEELGFNQVRTSVRCEAIYTLLLMDV